ncbi:MAG: acetyl-CoA carboxylase biotin carboxyl carrier protein subunit [Planctomycetes bacterium]|nr:acetyl-CoA carboxylase biotin carboxyl carrier protein subunit [Planctomycetota bacterium]MCC8115871.1 acetyl-CoA carboxylase biotin carboxyl carrier protein subunit [Planctomycetota bacterium]
MKYNVTLNSKVYEVEVERGEAILVSVQAVQAPAPVAAPVAAAPAAAAPAPAAALAGDVVAAQMPGTILAVKVNPGDAVTSGQIVVLMEAMKMEIEVTAPRDGKVGQVVVAKGATVESGAPLLTLV